MRVVIVNRFFLPDESATSQFATDLANALAARQVDVVVVTSRQLYGNEDAKHLASIERRCRMTIFRVWSTRFGRRVRIGRALDYLTFYICAIWCLMWRVRAGDRLVAMTDPPLLGVPCALIARLKGARLINWLQDIFPEVAERLNVKFGGWLFETLRVWRDWSLRAASENVVIGQKMAEFVAPIAGRVPTIIPNWGLEEGLLNGGGLRSEFGLQAKFVVCYSGNMGLAHQLDKLIDVAEELRDNRRIAFLFVGEGAQKARLESRTRDLGLENVQFRGYQPRARLRESLSMADIHVASLDPALEGLIVPSKFVGAIAVGRPVLWFGADHGEVGTIITEAGCGLVVGGLSAREIAVRLSEMALDDSSVMRMSAASTVLYERSFARTAMLNAWHSLLLGNS